MIAFILNLPFSLVGLIPALVSIPTEIKLVRSPLVIVFKVRKFWWAFGYMKKARAMTVGHIIMLGPRELKNDLEHELIHIKQFEKYLFLFPFLYYFELFKKGY